MKLKKIALILCIVMCFSALVSCKGTSDTSADVSSEISSSSVVESETESLESSVESSDNSSEPETTPAIPEKVAYFKGEYITKWWNAAPLEKNSENLNEWYSGEKGAQGIAHLLKNHEPSLDKTNVYYYVGIRFLGEAEEKLARKNEIFETVGFVPVDDKYLHEDYVAEFFGFPNVLAEDEYVAKEYEHLQKLIPNVDLSKFKGLYGLIYYFCYHDTGYITLEGLEKLAEEHGKIAVTWLPAPDDRTRFLTTYRNSSYDNKPQWVQIDPLTN